MSDLLRLLGNGHTVSLWPDDEYLHMEYLNRNGSFQKRQFPIESVSIEEISILLDIDVKDGQIWLERIREIKDFSPWYDDMWFNSIEEFQSVAKRPQSKRGRELAIYFTKQKHYAT